MRSMYKRKAGPLLIRLKQKEQPLQLLFSKGAITYSPAFAVPSA